MQHNLENMIRKICKKYIINENEEIIKKKNNIIVLKEKLELLTSSH